MKEKRIIRGYRGMKSKTDWARVNAMSDDEIDCSECPETDEEFWADAELIMPVNKVKQRKSSSAKPKPRKKAS